MTRSIILIGHPVGHSISPRFQGAALRALDLDITYEARDTPEEELADRVADLRGERRVGANVTIPHKQAVIPLLDSLDATARRVGAVNTIVNEGGRLSGHNTDGVGLVEALRKDARFEPQGRRCLLLGAGGAARAIAFSLVDAGADIAIHNRTTARAEELANDIGSGRVSLASSANSVAGYDCVVNTTSVGMHGSGTESETPTTLEDVAPGTLVVDIVYNPAETRLLREARALGLPVLGGLAMLVRQGALSFELWTGEEPPVEVMFDAANEALFGRAS